MFDGSTAKSTERDVSKVLKRLKSKEGQQFLLALISIQSSDVDIFDLLSNPKKATELNFNIIAKKIDGLNYQQVLELASQSPMQVSTEINKL